MSESRGCSLVAESPNAYGGDVAGLVAESPDAYGGDVAGRARALDRALRRLARGDSAARRVLGLLVSRFIAIRGYERLSFARLGDYGAERLGWSSRQLQDIARVAAALARLPAIDLAFRRGTLDWSKARLLVAVATSEDEARWLNVAATTDTRTLATLTANARAAAREERRLDAAAFGHAQTSPGEGVPARSTAGAPPGTPGDDDKLGGGDGAPSAVPPRTPGDGDTGGGDGAPSADASGSEEENDEERVLVRIPCTQRAIRLWSEARRLAPRLAGRALAQWEVAQLVAAEASSAPGRYSDVWQQEPWRNFAADRERRDARRCAEGADDRSDAAERPASGANDANASNGVNDANGVTARPAPNPPDSNDANVANVAAARSVSDSNDANDLNDANDASARPASDTSDTDDARSPLDRELERLDHLDAFELDAAMRRARAAMQRRQSELGSALVLFVNLRLYTHLGYSCSADYVRERLGIPDRTARDLAHVSRSAEQKSSALAAAYALGELSWLRTLTLLRVVRPWNAAAWIARAGEVTLRRLADEVAWAAEQSALDPLLAAAMPPQHGHDLGTGNDDRRMCAPGAAVGEAGQAAAAPANDDRRMCANAASADDTTHRSHDELFGILGRFRVTICTPLSVSRLFRTVLQGFAHPTEPRWLALERMLEPVLAEWRRQPRHRNPVFERDGYRCTAPGCSSRTNLHDHHIVPRSKGGSNAMSNRTTLCAWHHLRAVHGGLATASGHAPDAIDWELGLAKEREPLMRTRGDRYHVADGSSHA